ncbi:LytR/AlgR family response regulator transcription factor [Foetidibacter luteolus]|uniref:LytR/AlgR family response regulator transcription factor n=1 Tax=Foetidibacter luteolus TaxID=2608880 RepID=UPI001A981945|nr:LytTR family DNA-binding domain-containing protein [Foetidibacter luteolus]
MITAIIIDDEQHCINSLSADISKHCANVEIQAMCNSAKEGIMAIKKLKPQLIFLDVEMPWMNGFEMLEMFDHIDFCIIFTTAYDKFAAKAFRISAVDYLLKPIDAGDLKIAIKKAEEKINASGGVINIQNLLHNIRQPELLQKVALPSRDGYQFVSAQSILYCRAEGAYTKVFISDKHPLLISKTLGDIEEMLPTGIFTRIHHSTIVNMNAITNYSRTDGGYVVMNTGEKLVVSKPRKDALLEKLGLKKE